MRTTAGLKFTGAMAIGISLAVVCLVVGIWTLFQPSRSLNIGRADAEPVTTMNDSCPLAPGMVQELYAQDMTTFSYLAVRRAVHSTGILEESWKSRFGSHDLMSEISQGLAAPANPEEFVETKKFENVADEYLAGVMELYGFEAIPNEKRGLKRIRSAARKGYTPAIRQFAVIVSSLDDHLPEDFNKMYRFATHAGNCGDKLSYLIIVRQIEKLTPGKSSPVHKLLLTSWYRKAGIVDEKISGPAPEVARKAKGKRKSSTVDEAPGAGTDTAVNQKVVSPAEAAAPAAVVLDDGGIAMREAKAFDMGLNGIKRDPKKALELYTAEANKGNLRAQVVLGEKFLTGNGVAKNIPVARKWFEKSANLGDAAGAARFGTMLVDALGGPRDLTEAEKWLRFAADNGNLQAMKELVMVYKLTGNTTARQQLEDQLKTLAPAPPAANRLVH